MHSICINNRKHSSVSKSPATHPPLDLSLSILLCNAFVWVRGKCKPYKPNCSVSKKVTEYKQDTASCLPMSWSKSTKHITTKNTHSVPQTTVCLAVTLISLSYWVFMLWAGWLSLSLCHHGRMWTDRSLCSLGDADTELSSCTATGKQHSEAAGPLGMSLELLLSQEQH